jgi:hypothetical protein
MSMTPSKIELATCLCCHYATLYMHIAPPAKHSSGCLPGGWKPDTDSFAVGKCRLKVDNRAEQQTLCTGQAAVNLEMTCRGSQLCWQFWYEIAVINGDRACNGWRKVQKACLLPSFCGAKTDAQ